MCLDEAAIKNGRSNLVGGGNGRNGGRVLALVRPPGDWGKWSLSYAGSGTSELFILH